MFVYYKKGWRSKIYLDKERGLIKKVGNGKSFVTISNEIRWLKRLNQIGIGPKLIESNDDYFICKFIDGVLFEDYLRISSRTKILNVVKNILKQCFVLDKSKMDKKEMSNPYKHIIIRSRKPIMIDFERARYSEKPSNVSGFCQYLTTWKIRKLLTDKDINFDFEKLRLAVRKYKTTYSIKEFTILNKIITTSIR